MRVLILGGTGVFGSRLAELLVEDGHEVIIAGRTLAALEEVADRLGVETCRLDRDDRTALEAALAALGVNHVVDAAGPFQDYDNYPVVEAAIAARCNYFDLSDDADFTAGVSAFDDQAREAGVFVLSGVSSVPAISGAIVRELGAEFDRIHHIEAAIMPGNRAPRGRSVMAAILGQIGAPMRVWRGGLWEDATGWSEARRYDLSGIGRRRTALIGAPDLGLFPEHFRADTVEFRAGLELGMMQRFLEVWSWGRARRLLPSLKNFINPLLGVARLLEGFGSDQGGMVVRIIGAHPEKGLVDRTWTLTVGAGKGPFIPALPATILARKSDISPGARPAISELTRSEVEMELQRIGAVVEMWETGVLPLFQLALGADWDAMPEIWRDAHVLPSINFLRGRAEISRGRSLMSGIIGWVFRFPRAASDVPVTVRMEPIGSSEVWTRRFGDQSFRSVLRSSRPGHVKERFGLFEFEMAVPVAREAMTMPVTHGWFCGIPMPRWTLPLSQTREFIKDNRFHFDVKLSAPWVGLIVHYEGWLK